MLILFLKLFISTIIVAVLLAVVVTGIALGAIAVLFGIQLAASDFLIDGFKWLKTKFKRK